VDELARRVAPIDRRCVFDFARPLPDLGQPSDPRSDLLARTTELREEVIEAIGGEPLSVRHQPTPLVSIPPVG
jgi:hypothetical protein